MSHKNLSQTSPPVLLYYYWGQLSGQIFPRFSTPFVLQVLWFQNGAGGYKWQFILKICRKFENTQDAWKIGLNNSQDISTIPPPNFTGAKKTQILSRATDLKSKVLCYRFDV